MNPRELGRHVELALRKQRLQLRAAEQRGAMVARFERVESLLGIIDRAHNTGRALREEAPLLVVGGALLVALRPRLALRLARRAWLGYIIYRRLGRSLASLRDFFARFG